MRCLSRESLKKAHTFIVSEARPVDQAMSRFWFESGTGDEVVAAVSGYQNPDGGFGNAMEPDFRLPDSSPMATTVAFQYLRSVNASADDPVVRRGIEYLVRTFDPENQIWQSVPPEVNDTPHAGWWHYSAPATSFSANPGAEICACLLAYPEHAPENELTLVSDLTMDQLRREPDAMPMHDMLCYLHLAEEIEEPPGTEIVNKLRRGVLQVVDLNTEKYSGYCAKPIWLAPSLDAPLADKIIDGVNTNLDYEIKSQSASGCWEPFWSWEEYPEEWLTARREWQGYLTVKTLKCLSDYGRIAD